VNQVPLLQLKSVSKKTLEQFDIRQPVVFADLSWDILLQSAKSSVLKFTELPKQLPVKRDLAIILPKSLTYDEVERTVRKINLSKLEEMQLFDIFENEKFGRDKKSMAITFSFLDREKTLQDKEIDSMMNAILTSLQQNLQAEIRK
jgi:phenylalanyl-tRNA synthetase beta chain